MVTILSFLRGESTKINPLHSLRTRLGLVIGSIAFVLSILASLVVGHTNSEHVKVDVIIVGALFAVLAWLVAAAITNPLLAIRVAVDCIRQGNKQVKIPVLQGKDEIANLSKFLSQLVSTMIQQEKDLKASNAQLQLALEKEREINELKSRFIAIASHEFRTPLTTIVLSCDLLQNHGDKFTQEKKHQHFNKIKSSVKHLTQVLEDVLIIGTEAGKLKFDPAPLDLISFCLDLLEQLQLSAGKQHQLNFVEQCFYGCKTQDLPVMDEKLLRHIFTNLLSNAIKYSPKGGNIQFDLICDEKSAIFRIQDEGIGIPEQDLAKLFTSFFRCSNTGNLPGTGLGLAIVKNAVELHLGQITVESEVDVGTTFTVILPLTYIASKNLSSKGEWSYFS